ncbi:MAG TPA: subclass B3 metallo-beta-lactamase [Longimicrobiales bacterium]|nr:subclass B3 metallo-beta-lactamase [Longimicrobiales bacterium]
MPAPRCSRFLAALALTAASGGGAPLTAQSDWTEPREPFQIGEGLYYVGTAGLAAYLFTSEEGHILVDAPLDENVDRIVANIRAIGFDPADIEIQLASHAHFDHVGGLARMGDLTGADLVLSEADARFVGEGRDFGVPGLDGYPPARADRTIRHLESVELGPWRLTAHVTAGHTAGCTSWSGDVTIQGRSYPFVSVCSLSVLGNYRLVGPDATYEGQGRDYCASLAHLRTLSPDVFLAPHGSFYGLDEKLASRRAGDALAFVERERYERYLDSAERNIERTLTEQGHRGGCAALLGSTAR